MKNMVKKKNMYQNSQYIASLSKDNSTQVGAVFYNNKTGLPITFGYNGLPRGLNDNCSIKTNREANYKWSKEDGLNENLLPEKYLWSEHAERNAVYNVASSIIKKNMVLLNLRFPDMEGARVIVATGIKNIIYSIKDVSEETELRVWELFNESGVHIENKDQNSFLSKNKIDIIYDYLANEMLMHTYGEVDSFNFSALFDLSNKSLIPNSIGFKRALNVGGNKNLNESSKVGGIINYIESEKILIINMVRPILEKSVLVVNLCPCVSCAAFVSLLGIKKVITKKLDFKSEVEKRWKDSFEESLLVFSELGVKVDLLDLNKIAIPSEF